MVKRQTNSLKSKNKKKNDIKSVVLCAFRRQRHQTVVVLFSDESHQMALHLPHTHTHTVVSNSDRFYLGKFGQVFGARMC